jgi:hypothetical protein
MDAFDDVPVGERLRIADRLARYSWSIDSADLPAYLDCFTMDGTLRHPDAAGAPMAHAGRDAIERFISRGFSGRATQTYGTQHQFSAVRIAGDTAEVQVDAYVMIFRHEFHRQYWPRGSSWRMGTWHARMRREEDAWRIADVDVQMWTDTAWDTGAALAGRGPGLPGVRD